MKRNQQRLRRMGYVRDQQGIMNRYLREHESWEPHLERSREFVRTSFQEQALENIAVLGSGWLLDVPLEDLCERFKQVLLVDIFHPPQIVKKVATLEQVKLIEADLTGGAIEMLWQIHKERDIQTLEEIPQEINLAPPLTHLAYDAIVSVNLLNQLDIILCEFLEQQGYRHMGSLTQFRRLIQEFHLSWIMQTPGCLVTDTQEISVDKNGNESVKSLLYTNLPGGHRTSHWTWDFDSYGTYRPGFRTRMEVKAVEWS